MELKDEIKNLRIAKKLEQEELAQLVGVSRSTISGLETGRISPEPMAAITLINLAKVLGKPPIYFLIRSGLLKTEEVNDYLESKFITIPKDFSDQDINLLEIIIEYIKNKSFFHENGNFDTGFESIKKQSSKYVSLRNGNKGTTNRVRAEARKKSAEDKAMKEKGTLTEQDKKNQP